MSSACPNINRFMQQEMDRYKDGQGYSGPWVIGWAHCMLCGAANLSAVPLVNDHPLNVAMECVSCGQMELEFFYEEESGAEEDGGEAEA